ncbi:hypothetical protein CBM2599_A120542 [Cupriavidus taiwanensis]|uniref:DUF551 domain-containing protein n=1 Tax=Cupriavidus taiwanensis TaxID=164546 RepID=UPI000E168C7D|nr:DUF551 domain-containing protein [Cupriavidus taiwanensis]SOY79977.1 hypothetical protein CBM2599_A120542 [Cupriavidus taiwanensis]SOY81946.1 hypothetical protein CBM2600_A120564 [Cupriavidus taiwanensis]
MAENLKPCPCCGGKAELTKGYAAENVWPHGEFYRVFCGVCQLRQLFHRTPERAIAAWNKRAQHAGEAEEKDGYGETDFGYTFAGIELAEGDKRLMAMMVRAFGTDHPAMDDLTALLFRAAPQPAALPEGWISVYERLPDYGVDVLLYRPNAHESFDPVITIRARQEGNTLGPFEFRCVAVPTHWMPLPTPPGEQS